MKLKISEEKRTSVVLLGILVLFGVILYYVIQHMGFIFDKISAILGILAPFLIGLAVAYILWRPVRFFDRQYHKIKLGKEKKPLSRGVCRVLSVLTVFLLMILTVTLIGVFIIPQLKHSLMILYWKMPMFVHTLETSAQEILDVLGFKGNIYELLNSVTERFWDKISQFVSDAVPAIVNASVNITSGVINLFLAFIVSVYLLSSKEKFTGQLKKFCCAVFPARLRRILFKTAHIFDETFGGYINGQLTDAIVVGTVCFIAMLILQLPFPLLVAVIVMITNVIPMIGPFIGAVPSAFIILMEGGPFKMLVFIIMILVLQQVDGNILVPRIVGSSTGLSGMWVLLAIMLGGGLFGILGIVLSVPTLSVILRITKILVEKRLSRNGYPVPSSAYIDKDLTQ